MEWVYCEDNLKSSALREEYGLSLERLIAERRVQEDRLRLEYAKKILRDPETCRADFIAMLGWPLTEYQFAQPLDVRSFVMYEDENMSIQRLQLELRKSFWFEGILFLHKDGQKHPFVLAQHGGDGTPELCSGLFEMGSVNYNGLTRRIFESGMNVFAPQLYLWSTTLFGCRADQKGKTRDELRRALDASLKNLGGSIMAAELYCLRRTLDYFSIQPYVLSQAFGMAGLSYGGQYALFLPAVEPRIKASLSSCYFCDRHLVEWSDYTWFDAAGRFFDEEIAMLSRPRHLFIQSANHDPIFSCEGAQRAWKRLQSACGSDLSWVDFHVFEGEHEFDKDPAQLSRFIQTLKALS